MGAVSGQVSTTVIVHVTQPQDGVYMVNGAGRNERLRDEAAALDLARAIAEAAALKQAGASGAEQPVVTVHETVDAPEIEGSRTLIEARIVATATGRPGLARA